MARDRGLERRLKPLIEERRRLSVEASEVGESRRAAERELAEMPRRLREAEVSALRGGPAGAPEQLGKLSDSLRGTIDSLKVKSEALAGALAGVEADLWAVRAEFPQEARDEAMEASERYVAAVAALLEGARELPGLLAVANQRLAVDRAVCRLNEVEPPGQFPLVEHDPLVRALVALIEAAPYPRGLAPRDAEQAKDTNQAMAA